VLDLHRLPRPEWKAAAGLLIDSYHTFNCGNNDSATSDHGYLTTVTTDGKTILYGIVQCDVGGGGSEACGKSDGGDGIIF